MTASLTSMLVEESLHKFMAAIIRTYTNVAENPLSLKVDTLISFLYNVCTVCGFHKLQAMLRQLFVCDNLSPLDVNSWLVTFGFQLYNVIPGYHKPNTESMEPSHELVRTQIKTQEWDSTKVISCRSLLTIPPFTPLTPITSSSSSPSLCKWIPTGGSS